VTVSNADGVLQLFQGVFSFSKFRLFKRLNAKQWRMARTKSIGVGTSLLLALSSAFVDPAEEPDGFRTPTSLLIFTVYFLLGKDMCVGLVVSDNFLYKNWFTFSSYFTCNSRRFSQTTQHDLSQNNPNFISDLELQKLENASSQTRVF
jgi:hypothetical protein